MQRYGDIYGISSSCAAQKQGLFVFQSIKVGEHKGPLLFSPFGQVAGILLFLISNIFVLFKLHISECREQSRKKVQPYSKHYLGFSNLPTFKF